MNTRKRLNKGNLEEQKEWTPTTTESQMTTGSYFFVITMRVCLS